MPLDFVTPNPLFNLEGTNLDFNVRYEPTRMIGKKYVIRETDDNVLGIVGSKFKAASHIDFFNGVKEVIQENRLPHELEDAKIKISTARDSAFALIDITLPNVKHKIVTSRHQTEINERIIALHGIDGSCSNQVYFGAIDSFCTNGQIGGEYDTIKRKNTSGLILERLMQEVRDAKINFDIRCQMMQKWADTPLNVDGKTLLNSIIKSERLSKKMYELACQEIVKRGKNVFALYSAFTNYASYADERNGFNIRNTGFDTKAETMWKREQEVAKWISSKPFQDLLVAA
jgi:hypothetical protein